MTGGISAWAWTLASVFAISFLSFAGVLLSLAFNRQRGDETLKGTKYLWFYGKENVPEFRRRKFVSLRRLELKVGWAWAIKETLRELWHYVYPEAKRRFWKRWYFWVTHAVSEGLNSKIQTIKKMAYGFRNPEHFKTAIYFHCGGLDLYPC